MTISRLPSGNWRAQVWSGGKWVSVPKVIGGPVSYATRKEAQKAKRAAQVKLDTQRTTAVTVAQFRQRWTTDPLFKRPSESTNLHYAERTYSFACKYGSLPLHRVDDTVVGEWLAGGKHNNTVAALRAMFNDARSAKAGRLIDTNPFLGLGISRTRGNADKAPPNEEQARTLIAHARSLTPQSFAAYLAVGCFSGARPGELDALRWECVDFETDEIQIDWQYNAKTRKLTRPKHNFRRTIAMTGLAREWIASLPRESEWVFTTTSGHHYTPSSRCHHWNRVRAAAGMGDTTLYMATRHMFATYALNVLGLAPHVIAHQLGHRDGGKLVTQLYGHPDGRMARRRIHEAFAAAGQVVPLRTPRHDTA